MTIFNPPKFVTRGVIGAVGLSAIAFFTSTEVAQASGPNCGPGAGWVNNCPVGSDHFHDTWAKVHFEVLPNNPFGIAPGLYWEMFKGPTWIYREAGANGVINTTIFEDLISMNNTFGVAINLIGDGTGQILDDGSALDYDGIANSGVAGSFFMVSPEISINGMSLSAVDPVTVYGDRGLLGVSPDVIIPPSLSASNHTPPTVSLDCTPTGSDEDIAINYCGESGTAPIELFVNGDPNQSAGIFIIGETHTVHPVPEPLTILGSFTAFGFGTFFKRKLGKKAQQDKA